MSAHTPGPWAWHETAYGHYLATPDRGRLTVMDFVRRGMRGAQPRFAVWDGMQDGKPRERLGGIMHAASELPQPLAHPDALLIAAAPDVLAALKLLAADVRAYEAWQRPCLALDRADAAIAKAEGQ